MIIIVGAGPAGLALGYELKLRGRAFRILERERVGAAWHHHYDRLHLHTRKGVSSLPGMPMPRSYPAFPDRRQVASYFADYAARFDLPVEIGVTVSHASWDGVVWRLDTSKGRRRATHLVAATGIWSAPYRPRIPGEETFGGPIIHSASYRAPAPYRGQRVLVVGVGNSGAEIAVDLASGGTQTSIAVRSGAAFVARQRSTIAAHGIALALRVLPRRLTTHLIYRRNFAGIGLPPPPGSPIDHYPVVGYDLPDAVTRGDIEVCGSLERLSLGAAHFTDGRSATFDAVILATGFRPAIDWLDGGVTVDARGRPLVDTHWRARNNRHLTCIGYHYPTTEGWLQALPRVARLAAAGIIGSD